MRLAASLSAAACLFLTLALTGCTLTSTAPSVPDTYSGAAITGVAHGGQAPIVGQHIYLFAANTTGYGGSGIAASTSNASVSLLNSTDLALNNGAINVGWGTDGNGNSYVITDSNGNFNLTGDYTCTAGQQVYVYGIQGNTGSGNNTAAGLMAVLGNCPGGTFSSSLFVDMDEVTTVAAAYALAGFATDATHISSSGTTLAQSGIANAFATAGNLASVATGQALATTPGGNGTVPQNEIYTLANAIATCVNTSNTGSTISSACSSLFALTLSGATISLATDTAVGGLTPTDTATAAIYIAQNPGANVSTLYSLAAPQSPYPITGTYNQPYDFTISINYNDGGTNPASIAIDSNGNVWVANLGEYISSHIPATLSKLSPLGAPFSGSPFSGNGLETTGSSNLGMVIDTANNVWIDDYSSAQLGKFTSTGAAAANSPFSNLVQNYGACCAIAIDGNTGNLWSGYSTNGLNSLVVFSSGGALLGNFFSTDFAADGIAINYGATSIVATNGNNSGVEAAFNFTTSNNTFTGIWPGSDFSVGPTGVAIDQYGYIWSGGRRVVPGTSGTGASGGFGGYGSLAIDGAGSIWSPFSISGTPAIYVSLNPGSSASATNNGCCGYIYAEYESPNAYSFNDGASSFTNIAVDGSGNVWVANSGDPGADVTTNLVTEFIGIATPVITPLAAGTVTGGLGPASKP